MPSGSDPDNSGPIVPLTVMVSMWAAGSRVIAMDGDCAQIVEPSASTVATMRIDVEVLLDSIGFLLPRRQAPKYDHQCEGIKLSRCGGRLNRKFVPRIARSGSPSLFSSCRL